MKNNHSPNFEPKDIVQGIAESINAGQTKSNLASQGSDWESVVDVLDEAEHDIGKEMSVNSHLNSVMFNDDFNKQYEKTLPLISNYYSDLGANKELYQAFIRVKDTKLNEQQKHIVKESLRSFELSGVALDGAKSSRFKEIKEQLSLLSNQFSKNVLQATNSWKKVVSENALKGFSESELSKVRAGDNYEINLQVPIYIDLMTYADNRELREEVYKAYISRASDVGITSKEFDNRKIMDEILELRSELSQLVGFSNYAQYSVESKMVDSPEAVIDFLEKLIELSLPQARSELNELQSFAGHELMPWDLMYYSEKLKQKKFNFKSSDLKPYFPEESVFNGLFNTIQKLYGIELNIVDEVTYHSDVRVIELKDNDVLIGRIYLDVYARENKRATFKVTI